MKVFIGQALGNYIDEKDIKITEKLTQKALEKLGDVLYFAHPRVTVNIENAETIQSDKCFRGRNLRPVRLTMRM